MVYYGLSLNSSNLHGNIYLNCFISAAIDIVVYVATWLLIDRAPRPTLLFTTLMFCGIMLLVIKLVPEGMCTILAVPGINQNTRQISTLFKLFLITAFFFPDMPIMVQVLALVGKTGVSAAYCFIYVFFTELMPTVVRNMGLGICATAGRIGAIICPYLLYMGKCAFFLFFGQRAQGRCMGIKAEATISMFGANLAFQYFSQCFTLITGAVVSIAGSQREELYPCQGISVWSRYIFLMCGQSGSFVQSIDMCGVRLTRCEASMVVCLTL